MLVAEVQLQNVRFAKSGKQVFQKLICFHRRDIAGVAFTKKLKSFVSNTPN
jgi:hypothetical protein